MTTADELTATRAELARVRALAGEASTIVHRLSLCLAASGTTKAQRQAWAEDARADADRISIEADLGAAHRFRTVIVYCLSDRAWVAPLPELAEKAIAAWAEAEGFAGDLRIEIDAGSPPLAVAPRPLETDDDILAMADEMRAAAGGAP